MPGLAGPRVRPGDPLSEQRAGGGAGVLSGAGGGAAGQQDGLVWVVETRYLVGQGRHEIGRGGSVPGGVRCMHSQREDTRDYY